MKYVIMAGGPATRWRKYQGTTKHLIKIGKENLLERLVRQLKENHAREIYIISDNELYEIKGSTRIPLIYDCKLYNMFYHKFLNDEVTFLYGDTYYYDSLIEKIVKYKTKEIVFFGTNKSIVGIKVINHSKFKYHVETLRKEEIETGIEVDRAGWAIYKKINKINQEDKIEIKDNLVLVDEEEISNVNDQQEYENLIEKINNQIRY